MKLKFQEFTRAVRQVGHFLYWETHLIISPPRLIITEKQASNELRHWQVDATLSYQLEVHKGNYYRAVVKGRKL